MLVCTGHDIGRQAGALSPDQYRGRPGIIHPEDRLAIARDGSGNPAAVAPRFADGDDRVALGHDGQAQGAAHRAAQRAPAEWIGN